MFYPQILCSLTTHCPHGHTWEEKLSEISALKLTEFAVFLTGLKVDRRRKLYRKLTDLHSKTRITIPFVHATFDMSEKEYWFFIKNYKTEYFNIHPTRDFPLKYPLSSQLRNSILIENASRDGGYIRPEDTNGFGGVCFDLSHLEDERRKGTLNFKLMSNLPSTHLIGANHVSAVPIKYDAFSSHVFNHLSDFDYLSCYGLEFFGKYTAIELEDSMFTQLAVKDYITHIVHSKRSITKAA